MNWEDGCYCNPEIRKKLDAMIRYQKPEERNQQLFEHYIDELFTLPFFKRTLVPPPPIGRIVKHFHKMSIHIPGYPHNIKMRLTGPRGSTIKKMEEFCKCCINVHHINYNYVKVFIVCLDYGNVAKWRIDVAIKCINDVLHIPANGRDFVMKMQMDELAVRNGTYENRLMK
ncbi:Protein quaking-A [Trichinella zimbabwensis]|uniref:Protein quaking-A n=1 Tax=Trichinella zimbabwensis TaxID=268475 RepID=A0A0V1HGW5_9BILA|nr:Protein quaking-A [Trichinella zimbabwensis]